MGVRSAGICLPISLLVWVAVILFLSANGVLLWRNYEKEYDLISEELEMNKTFYRENCIDPNKAIKNYNLKRCSDTQHSLHARAEIEALIRVSENTGLCYSISCQSAFQSLGFSVITLSTGLLSIVLVVIGIWLMHKIVTRFIGETPPFQNPVPEQSYGWNNPSAMNFITNAMSRKGVDKVD